MNASLDTAIFKSDIRAMPEAVRLLGELVADPTRLTTLFDLQRCLLRRVRSRERYIIRVRRLHRKLRAMLRAERPAKEFAKQIKTSVRTCDERIAMARYSIFLWKCFGDGAACVYQSPYNLKHLYYDQDYGVKQEAGFLTGKDGLLLEWAVLEHGIRAGVPVMLSDLTNMIRYGDVCALAGDDPVPIEVKSSKNSGARVARQAQLLDELATFYANDGAVQFRGLHNVTRQAIASGPTYEHVMNDCIAAARAKGSAVANPEPGLHYVVASSTTLLDEHIDALVSPTTMARLLTATPNWVPCLPFTLTLRSENLIPFVAGDLAVVVLIDMKYLKVLFLKHGAYATMMMDGTWAIQLCVNPENLLDGVVRVSELHFARVGLEFQSLEWFAKENAIDLRQEVPSMTKQEFEALPPNSYWTEVPKEWKTVRDFYSIGPAIEPVCAVNTLLDPPSPSR